MNMRIHPAVREGRSSGMVILLTVLAQEAPVMREHSSSSLEMERSPADRMYIPILSHLNHLSDVLQVNICGGYREILEGLFRYH